MKIQHTLPIFICVLFCLSSCQKNTEFTLEGEFDDPSLSMVLVVYDDPVSKTDTIFPQEGRFVYKISPDTLNIFRLVGDSGESIPIFADQGWDVLLKGNFHTYTIKGNGPNAELQEFRNQITDIGDDKEEEARIAETFIKEHPQSFVSAYLLNKYFIQASNPDEEKIKSLMQPLNGRIKDCRILNIALKSISRNDEKRQSKEFINNISIKKRDGKYVSWNKAQKQYTLINFWATWHSESLEKRDSLYELSKEFKEDQFRVLNFSLDYNRKEWEQHCKKESEQWIEICDTKAWDNHIIKQMNIMQIPFNILVDMNKKVKYTNLYGDELRKRLIELTGEKKK